MVAASSHGLPPLWQIKPSDDGTTDHKEYASGTMPASIAGPDDELEIILTTPYSVGANGVAALALPGLFQQEQVKPGNANLTAPYFVGANGVASLELLGLSQQEQTEPCNTNHTTSCPVGHDANEAYRRVAAFGDTGIRLLQFLVEFHPGGVPSYGLASRDDGHSAAAI